MKQTTKELHQQRKKLWDASVANHTKYIDPTTGLFDTLFVEYRLCPVCQSDSSLHLFDKEGGSYVKCTLCSMVYLNPIFTDQALEDYYRQNHDLQSEIVESDSTFYQKLYTQGLDTLQALQKKTGIILDVGCSSGLFLDTAKKHGWHTYGVELNTTEANYAAQKGHTIFNSLLEKTDFDVCFDVISMWDVFEHLKNGSFYLITMKNLLSKNGMIILQIPSVDSFAAKILHERCNMFDGLEHVNLYGVNTITNLAQQCGLKILHISSVISEIGVINNYLQYEHPYLGDTNNTQTLFDCIDETLLHKQLAGYKLQIVLGIEK